jgi:tRNA pseudouridine55 synthase
VNATSLAEGEMLLIDKPLNWTSFDVVNKLRYRVVKVCGKKMKVGHAGTLDPLATGLLVICTGKMTKQLQFLQDEDKEYTGEITFGKTTPSYDAETEPDRFFDTDHITEERIIQTIRTFMGNIQQLPPMFSAIKVDGQPLYKAARKGQVIEVQPRSVIIHEFDCVHFDKTTCKMQFRVRCSKGTYIRSLAYDFGAAMESGAFLSKLVRTRSGDKRLENAWNLDDLIAKLEKMVE